MKSKKNRNDFPLMSNQRKMLDLLNILYINPTQIYKSELLMVVIIVHRFFVFFAISIICNFSFSRPKTSPFVAYRRMFESSWEFVDGPGGGSLSKSHQCLMYIVQRICSNRNWYEIQSTFCIITY